MADSQANPGTAGNVENTSIDLSVIGGSLDSGLNQISASLDRLVTSQNEQLTIAQVQLLVDDNSRMLSESIKDATKTSWTEAIILLIIGAVVAALTASIFNLLNWRIINRNEKRSVMGKLLVDQIDLFEKISIEYWMQPYEKIKDFDLCCMEARIKSLHSSVRANSKIYSLLLPKSLQTIIRTRFNDFEEKSFDVATGDDFESKKRKASKDKANQMLVLCHVIRSSLLSEIYK